MPLTSKGNKIMENMQKQYGSEKGKSVFYASKNKGTISGVDADNDEDQLDMLSNQYREAMQKGDTNTARLIKVAMRLITDRMKKSKGGRDAEESPHDLRDPKTPKDINDAYHRGLISINDRNDRMQKYGGMRVPPKESRDAELGHFAVGAKGTNQGQDAMPMTFACDGLPVCKAQIVARVGNCVLLEGLAMDSGAWFVRGPDGPRRFTQEQDALDYVEYANDAAMAQDSQWQVNLAGAGGRRRGVRVEAKTKEEAMSIAEKENPGFTSEKVEAKDAELFPGSSQPNKERAELYGKLSGHGQKQMKKEDEQDPRHNRAGSMFSRSDLEGMDIEKATVSYAKPEQAEAPTAAEKAAAMKGMR